MKIVVGFVTYSGHRFCRDVFFNNLAEIKHPCTFLIVTNSGEADAEDLRAHLKKHNLTGDVYVDDVTGDDYSIIVSGRNLIREHFLAGDADYLHMLDSDVLSAANRVDVFLQDTEKLSHRKHVLCGWYFGFEEKEGVLHLQPMIWGPTADSPCRRLTIAEAMEPKLFPVVVTGLGLTFLSRAVLEEIPFRTDPKGITTEDTKFFKDCLDKGFQPFCDTRITGWHLLQPLNHKKNFFMNPLNHKKKLI